MFPISRNILSNPTPLVSGAKGEQKRREGEEGKEKKQKNESD